MARQRLAVYVSDDRTAALARVTAPTLVVHGEADPPIPLSAGQAAAAALPYAELLPMPGMGCDLPRAVWLSSAVADNVRHAQRARLGDPSCGR